MNRDNGYRFSFYVMDISFQPFVSKMLAEGF